MYVLHATTYVQETPMEPGQESDNTGAIANSMKGRCKLTTLGEDVLKSITLGINAEAQAWHLTWR